MKKLSKNIKRKIRNRKKLKSVNVNRYRVSIFKSLKNISAQIIDDVSMKTLVSASSIEKEIKKNNQKKNGSFKFIRSSFSKKSNRKKNRVCLF